MPNEFPDMRMAAIDADPDLDPLETPELPDELGTIVWPNGTDLNPDVLHGNPLPTPRI